MVTHLKQSMNIFKKVIIINLYNLLHFTILLNIGFQFMGEWLTNLRIIHIQYL